MLRVRRGKLPLLALAVGATLPTLGYAQTSNWTYNAGGAVPWSQSWNVNTNWNPNTAFPNSTTAVVNLTADRITGGSGTIILNAAPITIGKLAVNPIGVVGPTLDNSYTLTGTGSLTIASGGTIDVTSSGTASLGVSTINLRLQSPAGSTVNKVGTGAVVLSGTNSFGGGAGVNGLQVFQGTVVALSPGALTGLGIVSTANDGALELQNQTVGTIPVPVIAGLGATVAPVNGSLYASVGSNTWNGNMFAIQNASVGVAAGATLTVNGNIFDGAGSVGNGFSKVGNGRLVVNNLAMNGPIAITGGTVQVKAGVSPNLAAGKSTASSLSITGTGKLDLTNNTLTVHYGTNPSPAADIRALLIAGRGSGDWQGTTGIMSSSVTSGRALGYRDLTGTQDVIVMYTRNGDANLDGVTNISDLGIVGQNYNGSGKVWFSGDFNYDGLCNINDLGIVGQNYNGALPASALTSMGFSPEFVADYQSVMSQVPEPGSMAVLGAAVGGLLSRRRRRGLGH